MNRDIFLKGGHELFLNALSDKEREHMNSIRYTDNELLPTRLIIDSVDVTDYYQGLEWSGNKGEVARKIDFELIHNDAFPLKIQAKEHKMVQFFEGEDEIFRGYIFGVDINKESSTMQITAYDGSIFLLKSQGHFKFQGKTPDVVTRQVCAEVNVPVGKLEKGNPYDRIHDGDTLYEIIMTGYTITSQKTGNHYYSFMDKGKLNVEKKGAKVYQYALDSENDIIDANYRVNSEDAINKVKAFDENGKMVAVFELDNIDEFPGILQAVYKGENPKTEGKALLKKPTVEASIDGLGSTECITGRAVVIHEPVTGLDGLFYIDSDRHTFHNGLHFMSLQLSLQNVMDKHMSGSEKEEEITSGGIGGPEGNGLSTGAFTWPVPSTMVVTQGFMVGGHRGIDIGGACGSAIVAADGGTVAHAGPGEDWSYGNSILISHGNGLFTRYAHLSAVHVRTGQKVSKGQRIGLVGNTGRSFGCHLHFEVLKGGAWGALQNPLNYVRR